MNTDRQPDPLDGCTADGCTGDPFEHGGNLGRALCPAHYAKLRRAGGTRTHTDANRPDRPPDHGTAARYRTTVWPCRCPACRAAVAAKRREERRGR